MLVGIKNVSKLIGISIIACCAVLVCTMFLNFYFDIRLIESEITSELSMFFYNAQVSTAKVVCLVSFTIVMVTHNLNIAEMANTVIKMNSGKISEIYTNEAQKTAYEIGW